MSAQDKDNWHKERLSGIGGSDVAAALGLSPWKTQTELWGEKTGLVPSSFEGNEYTYWGTEVEPLLRRRFIEEHPEYTVTTPPSCSHPLYPFLRANLDGIVVTPEGTGVWEAKTSGKQFSELPAHYLLQVQHYMFVKGYKFAIVSVLFNGNSYKEFMVDYDTSYETDVLPALIDFWDSVERKTPIYSPSSMSDIHILKSLDENAFCSVDIDLGDFEYITSLYYAVKQASLDAKLYSETERELKDRLAMAMAEKEIKSISRGGKAIATLVTVSDGTMFDSALFKKECPASFKNYQKPKAGYTSLRVY